MYDIKFFTNEKIELISDNTVLLIDNKEKECSSIVTNKRYLILDYPSSVYNSSEDLRISGRGNYIKKKEVIFDISISDIKEIVDGNFNKIVFNDEKYILVKDKDIILCLKNKL